MKSGDLEITAKLNRDGTPYSAQEDVWLRVEFKSTAAQAVDAPYIIDHRLAYTLKDLTRKTERKVDYLPPTAHGVPRFDEFPVCPVEPLTPVTYKLRLQFPFGFFPEGKYSVQLKVDAPSASFTTDWLEFEVLPMAVGAASNCPSSQGADAAFLHLAWRDDGSKPERILIRDLFIGKGQEMLGRTLVAGEGDAASAPVASMAPAGRDPLAFWMGWIAGDQLILSRVEDDKIATHAVPVPSQADFSLVPNLAYTEKFDGSDTRLAGMLLGRDPQGNFLRGFQGPDPKKALWLDPLRLPAGEVLAARMVVFSETKRFVLLVRREGKRLLAEAIPWDATQGLLPAFPLADLPPLPQAFRAFDAVVVGGLVTWALVLHEPAANGEPARLHAWTHSLNGAENRQAPGRAKSTSYRALPGPLQVTLRISAAGIPWVLQRDVHGPWAQAPKWPDPIRVDAPRGSLLESLHFKRGELPRVSLLDPDTGFIVKPVIIPTVDTEPDDDA